MRIVQNRADKSIAVSQSDFVSELQASARPMFFKYGVRVITASDPDIFEEEGGGVELCDEYREIYRSLNMSLMFAATRTYPECQVTASACASRFIHATERDMRSISGPRP